jgi:hypothetical protein
VTAGVLALALAVMGAGVPAKTVAPEQYAAGVCTVANEWQRSTFGLGVGPAGVQLPRKARLADRRRQTLAFVDDLARVSGRATRELTTLGVPDIPRGRELARGFVRAFATTHGELVPLRDRARHVTDQKQLTKLGKDVTAALNRWGAAAERLQRFDPERQLDRFADRTDACDAKPLKAPE